MVTTLILSEYRTRLTGLLDPVRVPDGVDLDEEALAKATASFSILK